jgi:DNA helicase-2/ATP-dependent DNA helicase PcrA
MEDLDQLARFAEEFGTVNIFLSELALMNTIGEDNAEDEEFGESLVLSTIHQAKGLEWKVVFVLWLVEERFPSSLALREGEGDEEERRLFYVAVTRARENLYLCHPLLELGRRHTRTLTEPSRFLKELPELVFEQWAIEEELFEKQKIRNGEKEEEYSNESHSGGGNGANWVDEYFDQTDFSEN